MRYSRSPCMTGMCTLSCLPGRIFCVPFSIDVGDAGEWIDKLCFHKVNTRRHAQNGSTRYRRSNITYPRSLGCSSEGEHLPHMHQTLHPVFSTEISSSINNLQTHYTNAKRKLQKFIGYAKKDRKIVQAMYEYLYIGCSKYDPRSWLAKAFSIVTSGKIVEWEKLKKFQLSCNNALLREKIECEYHQIKSF